MTTGAKFRPSDHDRLLLEAYGAIGRFVTLHGAAEDVLARAPANIQRVLHHNEVKRRLTSSAGLPDFPEVKPPSRRRHTTLDRVTTALHEARVAVGRDGQTIASEEEAFRACKEVVDRSLKIRQRLCHGRTSVVVQMDGSPTLIYPSNALEEVQAQEAGLARSREIGEALSHMSAEDRKVAIAKLRSAPSEAFSIIAEPKRPISVPDLQKMSEELEGAVRTLERLLSPMNFFAFAPPTGPEGEV